MHNPVLIKGNKYGIRLVLDDKLEFASLIDLIGEKFVEAERFFRGNVNLALTVEGRELSNEELDMIVKLIHEKTELRISYLIDTNEEPVNAATFESEKVPVEETFEEVTIADSDSESDEPQEVSAPRIIYENKATMLYNDSMFYKGTLRSGQSLESEGSIVVLGDVNPGASIISSGNIIVIGRLKGTAHAGATGNSNAFVMALSMNPMLIQIADAIARSADKPRRRVDDEAKIAFAENGNIYIEPVKKSVLNDIHL